MDFYGDADKPISLEDMLTHKDERARMAGRAVANGWIDQCRDWMQAEHNRDPDNGATLLDVLGRTLIQIYASAVGSTVRPGGYEPAREMFLLSFKSIYSDHVERTGELLRKRKAVRT